MEYSIVDKIDINYNKCEKVGAFIYDKDIDGLYLDMPWPFPVQIGFTHGLTKGYVTPMFLRLPFIMKGWVNEQILIREIKLLKLVLTNKILMHGSCYDNTLVVGFSNSGKTYQTYKSVSEGARLVSEEYTIIDEMGFAHPYERVMRTCFSGRTMKDCKMEKTLYEKIWLASATLRATLFPFMYEAVIWRNIPVSGHPAKIKKIVYGSTGREVKNWKQFAILCENEFPFMSSEFLQAYAIASGLDLLEIQKKQRKLIQEFVNGIYPFNRK